MMLAKGLQGRAPFGALDGPEGAFGFFG